MPAFDKPQWDIRYDRDGYSEYAGFSNKVTVTESTGARRAVPVILPSELFVFLSDVFKITEEAWRSAPNGMYLDQEGNQYFFGVYFAGQSVDLWVYPSRPKWATIADKESYV